MDTWLHPSPPIKTKNVKTGAHNRQSRNSPQPSLFTFLMVRSLLLRIGYFFCVLCKSTTYHLIVAVFLPEIFFSCANLESRVHSLHALGDTSETQHADYKHRKTLSFPYRYSTTVEPKFLRDLQILNGKTGTHLAHPGWLIPHRLSVLLAIFSFFNLLDSCFWFHACFFLLCFLYESGWCMPCRHLKRTRKKKKQETTEMQEKTEHYGAT